MFCWRMGKRKFRNLTDILNLIYRAVLGAVLASAMEALHQRVKSDRNICLFRCCFVVQSLSCVRLFVTPWTTAWQASLSSTISWCLLKIMSIESLMLSNHLILYCPFLLLPSIFPNIRVFSSESALYIRWPEYWSFSMSPSNEYSRLISFRIDWFDLFVVQGLSRVFCSTTIQKHQFFRAQLSLWSNSHIQMTTGKAIALTMYIDLCQQGDCLYFLTHCLGLS